MKPGLYIVPFVTLAVILLIRAELLGKRQQRFIFKPAATLLVIAAAGLSLLDPTPDLIYSVGVLVGLVLSLGGDIALMFDESDKAFAIGLGLFLLAQITYTVVFTLLGRFSAWDALSGLLLTAAGIAFYRLLEDKLGKLRGPIIVYMLAISVMVNRAVSTLWSPIFHPGQATMIASGAVLFYMSDVILALNRFWKPCSYSRISLALYYGGQLLIALGASAFGGL